MIFSISVLIWLILFVALVGVELATMQLYSIWFALGALVSMIMSAFDAPLWTQLVAFALVSALALCLTRPALKRALKGRLQPTNMELDLGKTATVKTAFENGSGRVDLSGVYWRAVSEDGSSIPEGTEVIVKRIEGTTLVVSLKEEKVPVKSAP